MRTRSLKAAVLTVCAALMLAPLPAVGQTAAGQWTAPRTPDGQPDLQGIWSFATITPLERPSRYAGREQLTAEEVAQANQTAETRASSDRRSTFEPYRERRRANDVS